MKETKLTVGEGKYGAISITIEFSPYVITSAISNFVNNHASKDPVFLHNIESSVRMLDVPKINELLTQYLVNQHLGKLRIDENGRRD